MHNALTPRLPDLADINQKLAEDMGQLIKDFTFPAIVYQFHSTCEAQPRSFCSHTAFVGRNAVNRILLPLVGEFVSQTHLYLLYTAVWINFWPLTRRDISGPECNA